MIARRHILKTAVRCFAALAGIVTFGCVGVLVVSHIDALRRAPLEKEYIERLTLAAKEDVSQNVALSDELKRQTEASLARQTTVDLVTNVLLVSSVLFLVCAKSLLTIAGRRPPELEHILTHRGCVTGGRNNGLRRPRTSAVDSACDGCSSAPGALDFVDEIIEQLGGHPKAAIPILHAIQERQNYLPEPALQRVCERTSITPAQIAGVSSFYSRFRHEPVGKHIVRVCQGTACHVSGSSAISEELRQYLGIAPDSDTDPQRQFTLEEVACLGCCTLAPVVQIEETTFGHLVPAALPDVLDEFLDAAAAGNGKAISTASLRSKAGEAAGGEIRIGLGSCCVAGGSGKVFEALAQAVIATGADVSVKRVGCVGMCHRTPLVELSLPGQAPVHYASVRAEDAGAIVNRHFRPPSLARRLTNTVASVFDSARNGSQRQGITRHPADYRDPPVAAFLGRQKHITTEHCATCDPTDLDEYLRHDGFKALRACVERSSSQEVIETIRRSGLRGRGGAGFPTGLKWSKVNDAADAVKYVICNGDEGDPGAFMDRMLMESVPYRIIEGLAIAAHTVGATEGYFYIRAEYPLAVKRIREALQRCEDRALLGANCFGPGTGLRLSVVEGAGAFVCGEETALIASIEGERGSPRLRPPFPAESGLWGHPTLVSNVETLATVPWIVRNGAEAFAELGTERSKGTKVFALAGKIRRGGLIEVPMGITIHDIVHEIGGGIKGGGTFKAVQIGGPSGGCIPAALADTPVDYEALTEVGAIMGSGGLVVLDESDCMVDIARYFLSFTQDQSCGKCTFCRIGTRHMLDILERLCAGEGTRGDIEALERLSNDVSAGSLCGLGKTAPNPVRSTLRYFRSEYEAHLQGRCPAGKCKALITYRVTDGCVGCTLCAQHCPADAIAFAPYEKHEIDTDKCTCCDVCRVECPEDAIEVI